MSFLVSGFHLKGDVSEREGMEAPCVSGEDVTKSWCGELSMCGCGDVWVWLGTCGCGIDVDVVQ